jgi:hypothetical protein
VSIDLQSRHHAARRIGPEFQAGPTAYVEALNKIRIVVKTKTQGNGRYAARRLPGSAGMDALLAVMLVGCAFLCAI